MSRIRALLFGLAAFALSACASAQSLGAADDVHALLISIRDNDGRPSKPMSIARR